MFASVYPGTAGPDWGHVTVHKDGAVRSEYDVGNLMDTASRPSITVSSVPSATGDLETYDVRFFTDNSIGLDHAIDMMNHPSGALKTHLEAMLLLAGLQTDHKWPDSLRRHAVCSAKSMRTWVCWAAMAFVGAERI